MDTFYEVSNSSLHAAVVHGYFLFFVLAGSSNAINLTDGIDGLAIGCTISATLAYGVFTYVAGNSIAAEYLFCAIFRALEK